MNRCAAVCYIEGVEGDESLLAAVAAGSEDALRHLYDRHSPAVLRLLRRLSNPSAEDLLQETWVAVWQSAGSFRGESSVRGWILGVARRQAHNLNRRRGVETMALDDRIDVVDRGDPVDVQVLSRLGHADLVAAVHELSTAHRVVAELGLVEGLSYPEIAYVLDIPVGTVKSRMSTARSRLIAHLATKGVLR